MKSLNTLEALLHLHHRAAGNTTAAIMAARYTNSVFIVAHRQHAEMVKESKEGRELRLILSLSGAARNRSPCQRGDS